ncbi:hypothetical protein [Georgenia sp. SYP-B2076]|uniref:hypothetical protein n=1 Tax=Georgenia sp. SYP-B2076 TaxID=2495881 RepID=UPI000F8D2648|nr:hypothetical protein [Georgenia sp. SYP-B2076]
MTAQQPTPPTSWQERHTRPHARRHGIRGLLGAAAVGLIASALAPSGTSEALWHSEATFATSGVTTDAVALATPAPTTPEGVATTITNSAAQVTTLWAPSGLAVTSNGSNVAPALVGSRIDYAAAPAGTSCTNATVSWSAGSTGTALTVAASASTPGGRLSLAPQQSANLCVRVDAGPALRSALGGQTLTLTTTLGAVAAAPAEWTSPATTWVTTFTVPAPAPVVRPLPVALTCAVLPANDKAATLTWDWPVAPIPSGAKWEILMRTPAGWTPLTTASSGLSATSRSAVIQGREIPDELAKQDILLKVRVYPEGDTSPSLDSTQVFTLRLEKAAANKVSCLSANAIAEPAPGSAA